MEELNQLVNAIQWLMENLGVDLTLWLFKELYKEIRKLLNK